MSQHSQSHPATVQIGRKALTQFRNILDRQGTGQTAAILRGAGFAAGEGTYHTLVDYTAKHFATDELAYVVEENVLAHRVVRLLAVLAAHHHHQVRQRLLLLQPATKVARDHLAHGREVIGALHRLDLELAVLGATGAAGFLIDYRIPFMVVGIGIVLFFYLTLPYVMSGR